MIRQANRFHGYGSLRPVYREGQTVRTQLLGLRHAPNKRRQQYRLAVVVSKKISKSAVARNRLRRRLYEVVRALAPGISQPHDLVITVYSESISQLPALELEKQVRRLLEQAGVIGRGIIEQKER